MKTLSFWESVYLVFYSGWLNSRFYYFPTEKNLLISFWYDYAYYRDFVPEDTVYDFLDSRVRALRGRVADPERKKSARTLEGYLLEALNEARIRRMIVDFLESPSPDENYRQVMEAMRSAWRMDDGDGLMVGVEVHRMEIRGKEDGVRLEERVGEAADEAVGEAVREEKGSQGMGRLLNAKAYVIGVELFFELEGREEEFVSLSWRLPDLRSFIQKKFGVEKLPGRLEEFKGYSYKLVLNGRNRARKGQLRTPFRQIMEHPEVFGEDVSARARKVLEKYFK